MNAKAFAQVIPPAGYTTSFLNTSAALFSTNYIGYRQVAAYDPALCAAHCDSVPVCNAFNIYYERTPVWVPNDNCNDPASLAAVSCALWGDYVYLPTAQNKGQYKNDFMVTIAGVS